MMSMMPMHNATEGFIHEVMLNKDTFHIDVSTLPLTYCGVCGLRSDDDDCACEDQGGGQPQLSASSMDVDNTVMMTDAHPPPLLPYARAAPGAPLAPPVIQDVDNMINDLKEYVNHFERRMTHQILTVVHMASQTMNEVMGNQTLRFSIGEHRAPHSLSETLKTHLLVD